MAGFIKLHRRIRDSYLWQLPAGQRVVAIDIMLSANWESKCWVAGGQRIRVARGEFITSIRSLSARNGVSSGVVRRALSSLQAGGTIKVLTTQRWTRIIVVNFDAYNARPREAGTPVSTKVSAKIGARPVRRMEPNEEVRRKNPEERTHLLEREPRQQPVLFIGAPSTLEAKTKPDMHTRLELAYSLYPVKKGKKVGLDMARRRINTDTEYEALLRVVRHMSVAWEGHDRQFCPHWSTFISRELWKDEEIPLPRGGSVARVGGYSQHSGDEKYIGGEVEL